EAHLFICGYPLKLNLCSIIQSGREEINTDSHG
ncbi:MAG: hypothetical protein ACI9R3_003030, partial [Verrucomicrobiales bacterium]